MLLALYDVNKGGSVMFDDIVSSVTGMMKGQDDN